MILDVEGIGYIDWCWILLNELRYNIRNLMPSIVNILIQTYISSILLYYTISNKIYVNIFVNLLLYR